MAQILYHYGELSTKGRNKKQFINRLADHIRSKTRHIPDIKVVGHFDFGHIFFDEAYTAEVIEILQFIPGIQHYAQVFQVANEIAAIEAESLRLFEDLEPQDGETFKVVARRSNREFELDSMAIQRQVGAVVGAAYPQLRVDLRQADYRLQIHIQTDGAYISLKSYPGLGGLPYGSSGRGMLMLSGGFDSPIAGYLMIKRGLALEMVHFSSPPYTSKQSLIKTKKLTALLSAYALPIKFHNVPFTEIQEKIKEVIPDGDSMTITRRMMMRLTDALVDRQGADAIVTGESLGQVASQTIKSMRSINAVTTTPVLRPLISTDKNEIIQLAQAIGSYDLSNEPFEDCCTVFAPQAPRTQPKTAAMEVLEQRLDIEGLIANALEGVQTESIDSHYLESLNQDFQDLL